MYSKIMDINPKKNKIKKYLLSLKYNSDLRKIKNLDGLLDLLTLFFELFFFIEFFLYFLD